MIKSEKEELAWLHDLQRDLVEDRRLEIGNASPLYYTIEETKRLPAPDEYQDGTEIYDTDEGCTVTVDDLFQNLNEEERMELTDEPEITGIGIDPVSSQTYVKDEDLFIRYMCENDSFEQVGYAEHDFVVPDTLFLTRKDANRYLEQYGYNHGKDAHSYAMTAYRSFRYEHLLELLHNIDWTKSDIKFLIPDHYMEETEIRDRILDYVTACIEEPMKPVVYGPVLWHDIKDQIEHRLDHETGKTFYDPTHLSTAIERWQKEHADIKFTMSYYKWK